MTNKVHALVSKWDKNIQCGGGAPKYWKLYSLALYHQESRWGEYLPAKHASQCPDFMTRLERWMDSVNSEKDKKILLEYLSKITFISRDDFVALYQTALNRCIYQWIDEDIKIGKKETISSYSRKIEAELDNVLFLPFTDSMDINEFFKVNNLSGREYRPALCSLNKFCESGKLSINKIKKSMNVFMRKRGRSSYSRIVVMEDMVGSGNQVRKALKWLIDLQLCSKILFLPLILCKNGEDSFLNSNYFQNRKYQMKPVLRIGRSELVGPESQGENKWSIIRDLENLLCRYKTQLGVQENWIFGYKNTGSSVVLYTNTPNNSLPIIHGKPNGHGKWEPLFPRVGRIS